MPLHTFPNPFVLLAQAADTGAGNQQQQVLRAINDSVGSTVSPWILWTFFGVIAALIAVSFLVQKYRRPRLPGQRKLVRHPRKLLREIARELELTPSEIHKLEHHATRAGVDNPLTVLLCPSLLKTEARKE